MRKKAFCLLFAFAAFCSTAFCQITVNGTTVSGSITNVSANAVLFNPAVITFTASDGAQYLFRVLPFFNANNPAGLLTGIANDLTTALFNANVRLHYSASVSPAIFGPNGFGVEYVSHQTVAVPFDFGLSAVMGAGAIAAFKSARKRRKEQETVEV